MINISIVENDIMRIYSDSNMGLLEELNIKNLELIRDNNKSEIWKSSLYDGYNSYSFILKYYKKRDNNLVENIFNFHNWLYKIFKDDNDFGIPKPYGYVAENNGILMESVNGKSLTHFINGGIKNIFSIKDNELILIIVGEFLWRLQKSSLPESIHAKNITPHDVDIDRHIEIIQKSYSDSSIVNKVKRFLDRYLNKNEIHNLVVSQFDYSPWNIILNGERQFLIDFEDAFYCQREQDLANMYNLLSINMPSMYFKKRAIKYSELFLSGYGNDYNVDSFIFWRLIWLTKYTIRLRLNKISTYKEKIIKKILLKKYYREYINITENL